MACNENVIKNIANEVTRECQAQNVIVEPEFVTYLVELLLLNPKYGKLFSKTINRNNLAFFVDECGKMVMRGGTPMNTLKIQFIMQTNYDKLQNLVDKHLDSIDRCLRPLVSEILDEDPGDSETEFKKLFRKISIYIVLASGLGNPGVVMTLKEGMAALESVLSLEDLKMFVALPRLEKMSQLNELMEIVSGVRLFNRDCKKGGEGIPDLPFKLVDAGKACLTSLSNALIAVMQRVNTLTTAIEDSIIIHDETGNVSVSMTRSDLTIEDYTEMFEQLAFARQYEVYTRALLADAEALVGSGAAHVERAKNVLEELHAAVKYKAAVPVVAVFPLFTKLWHVWRAMQNVMYLVATMSRLMAALAAVQEQVPLPLGLLDKMLKGRLIMTDQDRMNVKVSIEDRLSLGTLHNYLAQDSYSSIKDKHVQFLGFCALCLTVGALVPSNMKVGVIKSRGYRYGFCSVKMAARFAKDPERYVNEVLNYARNNPQIINLLNITEEVYNVKDVDTLVTKHVPKIKVMDKDIQTESHPIDSYIEKNYHWDLWEWKRRACQWANIVNCQTHSTQTIYSHLRAEMQCQTVSPRDKCQQTMRECGVDTNRDKVFLWGLRGRIDHRQRTMDLSERHSPDKKKAQVVTTCSWPCIEPDSKELSSGIEEDRAQS